MCGPAFLFSLLLIVPHFCLYQLVSIRKKTMPNYLNSRRVLRMVDLEQTDLQKRVAQRVHQFSIVRLYPLLHSKFFVIPHFLGNHLHDLLGRLCFSFLILQITNFFLFEHYWRIDSPDEVPSTGIGAVDLFHESNISILHSPLSSVQFSLRFR